MPHATPSTGAGGIVDIKKIRKTGEKICSNEISVLFGIGKSEGFWGDVELGDLGQ